MGQTGEQMDILGAHGLWSGAVILAGDEAPVERAVLPTPTLKRVKIPILCQPNWQREIITFHRPYPQPRPGPV